MDYDVPHDNLTITCLMVIHISKYL
jgi:hypothetical protein